MFSRQHVRISALCLAVGVCFGAAAPRALQDASPAKPIAPEQGADKRPAPQPAAERGAIDAAAIARRARIARPVPGIVCAVVDRDGVRAIGADGVRVSGGDQPIRTVDRMHLGSCQKAFTATLAAVLVAEGKLRWDSTIEEALGTTYPAMDSGWKAVTLAELLQNRGGAPGQAPAEAWMEAVRCDGSPMQCRNAFVGAILAGKPAVERGTFEYSNQGYALAGRMLEQACALDYESLLAARVLMPLGIRDFGFGPPSRSVAESPKGHDQGGQVNDIDNPAAIAPAGTLHMPVGEWAKFIAFHLGATPPTELERAARELATLHRPCSDSMPYAMGWRVAVRPWGGTVLNHAGSNSKWYCVAWLAPEKGFAVLAACNEGGEPATQACDAACAELLKACLQPASPAAPAAPAVPAAPTR